MLSNSTLAQYSITQKGSAYIAYASFTASAAHFTWYELGVSNIGGHFFISQLELFSTVSQIIYIDNYGALINSAPTIIYCDNADKQTALLNLNTVDQPNIVPRTGISIRILANTVRILQFPFPLFVKDQNAYKIQSGTDNTLLEIVAYILQ